MVSAPGMLHKTVQRFGVAAAVTLTVVIGLLLRGGVKTICKRNRRLTS